jgi:sarcosine oxidase
VGSVRYDAIVVGLGAMGAAALAALATRGARAIGFERFTPPHRFGSSQGGTRIIREAYFEDPRYVPLVQRAYERWAALEAASGARLLVPTGGLTIGPPDGRLVTGALTSARQHGLAHDLLAGSEVARRWPSVLIPVDRVAVHEPRAGVLLAARAIQVFVERARAGGAEVRTGAPIDGWEADDGGVVVRLGGEVIAARRLVLAAGSWMPSLAAALAPHLRVERNVVHWFRPASPAPPPDLPVLVIEDRADHLLYAVPSMRALGDDLEDGVKFARHHSGDLAATADAVDRTTSPADAAAIAGDVARYLPALDPTPVRSSVCCYTNSPDGHFVIDRHPAHAAVILASPCSGHGFKFAPVLGEALADLALDATPAIDLAPFSLARLGERPLGPD